MEQNDSSEYCDRLVIRRGIGKVRRHRGRRQDHLRYHIRAVQSRRYSTAGKIGGSCRCCLTKKIEPTREPAEDRDMLSGSKVLQVNYAEQVTFTLTVKYIPPEVYA